MNRVVLFAAAPWALLAAPAVAETSDGAPPGGCELHVWPGSGLKSVYHGWLHGGLVNGAIDGREGYPEVPPDPMATSEQAALLAEAQPQRLLMLAEHRLVVHDEALSSRTIRSTPGRIDPSQSTCYAELIVDDVFLQQDVVNGSALKILFRYRNFGADTVPQRTFGTWVQTAMPAFPPKRGEGPEAALADIRRAFAANVERFAAALLAPPKRRR